MARTAEEKVRGLRETLYRAAKADEKRRFHALYDKVYRRDVMERAWEEVRRNRGASGIDGTTIKAIEEQGVDQLLEELIEDLRRGTYEPLPARRVWIDKPGKKERRPLSIPAVRDRIVQAALKLVLEPVFEADFSPRSFGFRPGRTTHDALQALLDETERRRWAVETDIANCFEAIPHGQLMEAVAERVVDGKLLKLVRGLLRAGVMEEGRLRRGMSGTPQGGVASPLLCNVYLNRLDRAWETEGRGVLIRYADDLVVMCSSRGEAEQALAKLTTILKEMGLEPKAAKTRIVYLEEGGEGIDFLGFHHRAVRSRARGGRRGRVFIARWPSREAEQRARDRIRELTGRSRLLRPLEEVVRDVNTFLRGWAGYFRIGNSARAFSKVMLYAISRICLFVGKQHQASRRYGWGMYYRSGNRLGLINLSGIVVAPRPGRPWRELVTEHPW